MSTVAFKILHPFHKALFMFLIYTEGANPEIPSYVSLIAGEHMSENHPKIRTNCLHIFPVTVEVMLPGINAN